jgi:hypothetical protein
LAAGKQTGFSCVSVSTLLHQVAQISAIRISRSKIIAERKHVIYTSNFNKLVKQMLFALLIQLKTSFRPCWKLIWSVEIAQL